jgi:N-ethylmaleimide reductase
MSMLFSSIGVGPLALSHRVVMAPLTRSRSEQPGDVPGDLMREYYTQRASNGGLVISEATTISISARGWLGAPGLYSDPQVEGWKKITTAVHAKGGHMFAQLWHTGRSSPHRALEIPEIKAIVEDYRNAARRAMAAGFDGVELHAANGYLPDQFLQDGSNKRTDSYGGSIQNRSRLLLEIVDALVSVWGGDRVAVRISPSGTWNGMSDSNPQALFSHVALQLNQFGLAYLHVIEPRVKGSVVIAGGGAPVAAHQFRKIFKGKIIAAGGFEPDSAEAIIKSGDADLVSFGRYFVSNPDLPLRIERALPLSRYDRDTFYTFDAHGYTDYPPYEAKVRAA